MTISEPVTMLTDYMIFGQSVLLAWLLQRSRGDTPNISRALWTWSLVAIGLAALFGGTHHGFSLIIPEELNNYLWKTAIITVGFVSCLVVVGTAYASISKPWRNILVSISLAQLLIYVVWISSHDEFIYVILNYVPSMILVFILQAISFRQRRTGSELFIMSGIVVSFIGAGVQQSGFALHQHFNHNDIYHLIQMVGIYLFYRGVLHLKDLQ